MSEQHSVEFFSGGCALCREPLAMVRRVAGEAAVVVHDMALDDSVRRAEQLGVRSIPAVAVNGTLAPCCSGRGVDEQVLAAQLS